MTDAASTSGSHECIVKAIRDRRLLRFAYGGFERVVDPHTFGLDRRGQALLVGFQVAGASRSGELGWKTFRECAMTATCVLSTSSLRPHVDYRRDDGAFASIIAQR